MPREFKPVRFFVLVAIVVAIGSGVTAFYTHRAAYGSTPAERAGYAAGARAAREAPPNRKLPTAAALNMMAQDHFNREGSGNKQDWDLGFENGYEAEFKKAHP